MKYLLVVLFAALVSADVYMHNPRGSNNRLDEENTNRQNANRLFDSQNNGRGGYCHGPTMSYYEGSELSIEWTHQHSCNGEGKTECDIVLQYMCAETGPSGDMTTMMRDGTTTETINSGNYMEMNSLTGTFTYGMHESYDYYLACDTRQRNMGLFIADRNINGQSARFTRQNNNGNRHGFECNEERDYYPYWHPTPWIDIAVLTSDTSRCSYYREWSQNNGNNFWGWCETPDGQPAPQNHEQECLSEGNEWMTWYGWSDTLDVDDVDCTDAPWSRDNHLGNGVDDDSKGHANMYNWTIPRLEATPCTDHDSCACVLRLRYNITPGEVDGWAEGGDLGDMEFHDWTYNGVNSPIAEDPYTVVAGKTLRLEVNTNQYGRTFEDRSQIFNLLERPSISSLANIYNLNVRGKRGNIVECYPAVEYDFVPVALHVQQNDYIHFQWTGCDNNPANNAGQGADQTDRSNLCQIAGPGYNYPLTEEDLEDMTPLFDDIELREHFAYLGQSESQCDTAEQLPDNENDAEESPRNCFYLNAAPAYFNGGLIKMNSTGTFYFMSTRNNNYTNRSQKGSIHVGLPLTTSEMVGVIVGATLLIALLIFGGMLMYGKNHPHTKPGQLYQTIVVRD